MRRSTVFVILGLSGIVGAVGYEALRSRPPRADPVASREPLRSDEASRMEGGLVWRFSKAGKDVFEMHAESIVGLQNGAQLLEDVSKVLLFMEDGRPVELSSAEGSLKQTRRRSEDEVEIVLRGDVVVEDPDGTILRTELLRYDAERRLAISPGPATVESPEFEAEVDSFEYRPEVRLLETRGQLVVRTRGESSWTIDAQKTRYRMSTGEFVFAEPFRMSQPGHALVSGPAVVTLPREGRRGVFSGKGPVLASSDDPRADWQLSSGALVGFEDDPQSGAPREISFGPPSTIVARSAADASTPGGGSIGTTNWLISPGDPPGSLLVRGGPGFEALWRPEDESGAWSARGERVEMLRLDTGEVASMNAEGSIEIRGPDDVSVFGDALRWSAVLPEEIRVRGDRQGAQAFQGEDLIEAPLLRVLRARKVVVGEQGAITEIRTVAGGRGSLFEGEDPLRVRSQRVLAPLDAEGETVFEGPVKAWQFDTTLDAARMRFRRQEERLIAESGGEGRPVRGRFVLGEEGRAPRTVLMTTDLLDYFARDRRAELEGGATFKDGPLVVNAERMTVILAEEGGIERLEAVGQVTLEHRDDNAECERLVWTGGDAGVIELFGSKPLARLYAAEQNQTVRSARIRYYPETETFETEGGGGRTVIGAPENKPAAEEPDSESSGKKDEGDGQR